jgi:uncharacterized protein (TIGR02453 family)
MTPKSTPRGPFEPGLLKFLADLAQHNERTWFLAHKADYERLVRDPALNFIRQVGPKLASISPSLVADPKPVGGSLSRIYRDVRFSKDKSPYKTNVGVGFGHVDGGAHAGGLPGIYLHLKPGESMVAAGAWRPEPAHLARIRQAIAAKPKEWAKVGRAGIVLGGESLKRVPPGFDPDHPFAADLKHKDFVASSSLTDRDVSSPQFVATFLSNANSFDPLNRFLADAVGIDW